ncbi:hypothetical protein [Carnobacterium divergens]|uniref:hypothetical protein n=1 Tax=Carnobacterium divergens TaxID=2748 RepID=UPI00288FB70F|nr:hypothetical protein [Carnobacterium divergens]MDT1939678.1 hypothetical protein [Carnobacterium divergens]MDT1942116.1 hypothetical protein [Carnobacterium divergens]MDT1947914.1 hypothetical protein [Carnobacterium divergens]MDT1950402.1 hypothetical protein [Carnobacterium divergens]MDT1955580.1 hypothetical protein [Carnobacterium divergens]
MEMEQILTTKITIDGHFQDCQLYSGHLYLWNDQNNLAIYDWNKWMKSLNKVERVVYYEPRSTEYLHSSLADLEPFLEKTLQFNFPILDSAIFKHTLYYSDITGFYAYSLLDPHATKLTLWDEPVQHISVSKNGRIALSAGENGLFEYDATKKWTLQNTSKIPHTGIYLLNASFASSSEWSGNDLIQYGENPLKESFFLTFGKIKKQLHLVSIQPAEPKLQQVGRFIKEFPLPLSLEKQKQNEGQLFSYETKNRKLNQDFQYRSKEIFIKKMPSRLNKSFNQSPQDLSVSESETESHLLIRWKMSPFLQLPKAMKWRVYDRSIYYKNQLHILQDDELTLYIFTLLETS